MTMTRKSLRRSHRKIADIDSILEIWSHRLAFTSRLQSGTSWRIIFKNRPLINDWCWFHNIHSFIIQFWSGFIPVYGRGGGWPDLPHSNSNLSNSYSPSHSIHGILLLQTNTLALLLHLHLPGIQWVCKKQHSQKKLQITTSGQNTFYLKQNLRDFKTCVCPG